MSDLQELIAKALPFKLSPPVLAELAETAQPVEALEGDLIYESGATANALYIVRDGTILLEPSGGSAPLPSQAVKTGEAFGWTALGGKAGRRYRAIAVTAASLLRIDGNRVLDLAAAESRDSTAMREQVAGALQDIRYSENRRSEAVELALYRFAHWLRSPAPYLGLIGYALLLGFWYMTVEVLKLPRFAEMPGLTQVLQEWLSRDPTYGVSIYTPVYYQHILVSVQRIAIAFTLATTLGV
ncbi:MAG TPA: cyclic nucleotide-binding domain-containing protein, partial [Methylovirgula sp.]